VHHAPSDFPLNPAREVGFTVPGIGRLKLWAAESPYDLLDHPRYIQEFDENNEIMPYWSDLWPAAQVLCLLLSRQIGAASTGTPQRVLEIGAGLGAAGISLARLGHEATLTDAAADALRILRVHQRENGLDETQCHVAHLDFYSPAVPGGTPFDLVVGSDILFEKRICQPVLDTLGKTLTPTGVAWVADPCRDTAKPFEEGLQKGGWRWSKQLFDRTALAQMGLELTTPVQLYHIRLPE